MRPDVVADLDDPELDETRYLSSLRKGYLYNDLHDYCLCKKYVLGKFKWNTPIVLTTNK